MKKVIFCLCVSVSVFMSPNAASADELKVLVVVSDAVEALYDGNNVYAAIEDRIGESFEEAGLVRPTIVLSATRPQLAEAALSKDAALSLAHLPAISNERSNYFADLVLMVLLRTN